MSAVVIPFKAPKLMEPRCSFCARAKSIVRRLVESGDGAHYICDRCIFEAKQRADSVDGEKQ